MDQGTFAYHSHAWRVGKPNLVMKTPLSSSCRGAKAKSVGHGMSKLAGVDQAANPRRSDEKGTADKGGDHAPYWVPHPRTGIYFPKGHEWVMEEVPNGAASFGQTYWLRNTDGVDKPDPYQFQIINP